MAADTPHMDRRGLSRRDLIKASAAAGAVAWTAPVIIDSLSSPAAAVTVPVCASCTGGKVIGQASYHITNAGSNGTATCPATAASAPAACRPTCYTVGADTCTVPFTVTPTKSGGNAGVIFTMNGSGTFLSGTSYNGAACLAPVGVITSPGGTSTMTFAQQGSGYDVSLTWCA